MTQVHQHHHAKLRRHPGQRNKPGAGGNRQMEPHPVQEPDTANEGERYAGNDQQCLAKAAERQVEQDEDDHQRHRHHQLQLLIGAFEQLKLSGVRDADPRFHLHLFGDGFLQVVNHGDHVAIAGVDVDPTGRAGILGFQHRRTGHHLHFGDVAEGDLLFHRGQDWQLAQGFRAVAIALRVADVDRIALDAFYRFAHHGAADGRRHKQLNVAYGHAIAGRFFAVDSDIKIAPAHQAFCQRRGDARYGSGDHFDPFCDLVDIGEYRAGNLNADRAFDPGGEHIDAVTNRRYPQIGQSRQAHGLIQLLDNFLHGHPRSPLRLRLELNGGFDHFQRRGVGGGFCLTGLAKHAGHFRHGHDQLIGLLQHIRRLRS